MYMYMVFND